MGPEDAAWAVPLGFFAMATGLGVGVPLVKALAKRWADEAVRPKVPNEVLARLERMEQAIDSVAIEVERISEGQRFTTKLLSDRSRLPADVVGGDGANR
jgi:hypothetical protein